MHRLLQNALERRRTGVSWLIQADSDARIANEADTYLQSMFCENGNACGTCPGCLKYRNRSHVDFMQVDGTKVDDVRELIPFAAKHAFEGTLKAAYIPHADKLTEPAQNALLKLLEEPPPSMIIVLGAANLEAVLPTILSRCTLIEAPPDSEGALQRVTSSAGVSEAEAGVLLAAAGGDYGGAMSLHGQGFLDIRKNAAEGMHRLLTAGNRATSKIEKLLGAGSDSMALALQAAVLYLADVLQMKYSSNGTRFVNEDLADQLRADARVPARRTTTALIHLHGLTERMHACRGLSERLALQGTLLNILEETV